MSRVIILDTGPLGLLTNPKKTPETRAITRWALDMMMIPEEFEQPLPVVPRVSGTQPYP